MLPPFRSDPRHACALALQYRPGTSLADAESTASPGRGIRRRGGLRFAAVETVRLGDSGLEVSRVGLGCNNFGRRIDMGATRAVVEAALEAGVTFFDTAETYGGGESERFLGEIIEGRRDGVVLATKFGWGGEKGDGSAAAVQSAIGGSLERLRTDHVDLYYLHKPDPSTPVAETLRALNDLVEDGRARAIGICNASAEQLAEADRVARQLGTARFTVVQNEYSLLKRDDDADVLPLCREFGISLVPYFPLASGLLTGKYRRGEPAPEGSRLSGRVIADERFDRIEAFEVFAGERGHTLLELAVSALASTPGMGSIIAGATRPEQVRANATAAAWRLTDVELDELARI
jgi:aryl-alcohol dehydrogenase-like predicted oxidoreductase